MNIFVAIKRLEVFSINISGQNKDLFVKKIKTGTGISFTKYINDKVTLKSLTWWHFSPFHPLTLDANPWLLSTDCMIKESGQVDIRGLFYETSLWERQQSCDFEVPREGNQDCSLHHQGEVSMEKYIWKSRIWFFKQDRNPWTLFLGNSRQSDMSLPKKRTLLGSWALVWYG